MRIFCCLNRDLASSLALNLLLPAFSAHEVRVGLTEQVGKVPSSTEEHPYRRLLRRAEQAFPNEIFFPLIERAGLPDDQARYLTFAEVEHYRHVRVGSFANPNSPEGLAELRAFAPDLILCIRYGAILKSDAISIPRLGVLNLHSGLLPRYRGVLATFRALSAGDTEIGCTLHFIADGTIDTGPIVRRAHSPVIAGRSLLWHVLSLYPPGARLITDALRTLSGGTPLKCAPPTREASAYYSHPTYLEWEEFRGRGILSVEAKDLHAALSLYFCNQELPDAVRDLIDSSLKS